MSTDTDALADELRRLADLDARSGEPVGKCMRRAADMIERQAEIRWLLGEFVRFAGDAPRLDFHEDKTLSWVAVMTDRASKALAGTAVVKDCLTTQPADRAAIENETLERAAVNLGIEVDGLDPELRPTMRLAIDVVRSLKGTPAAAPPVQTGEPI